MRSGRAVGIPGLAGVLAEIAVGGIGGRVLMRIADRDIRVVTAEDGELLRHPTLDPNRDYQPQTLGLAV